MKRPKPTGPNCIRDSGTGAPPITEAILVVVVTVLFATIITAAMFSCVVRG